MPDSLFTPRPARRGRVTLTLVGSLLFHGGLVGVAALWPQSVSSKTDVPTIEILDPGMEETPGEKVPMMQVVEPSTPTLEDQVTPPVEVNPVVETVPTPSEEVDMATPEMTPPRKQSTNKLTARAASTAVPAGVRHGAENISGQPDGVPGVSPVSGAKVAAAGWVTPRPAYPRVATLARPTGTTRVRCTTNALGEVVSVTVVASAGSSVLDNYTTSFVRTHWKGPPNASREVEFLYQLK